MQNKISVKIAGNSYTILADEPAEYMRKVAARTEVFMQEAHHLNGGNAYGTGVLATLNASDALVKTEMKLAQAKMQSAAAASAEVVLENEKLKAMLMQNEIDSEQTAQKYDEVQQKLERSEAHNQQLIEKLAKQANMLTQLREQLDKMKEATATLAENTENLRKREGELLAEQAQVQQRQVQTPAVEVAPSAELVIENDEVSRLRAELSRQRQVNDNLQQRKKK